MYYPLRFLEFAFQPAPEFLVSIQFHEEFPSLLFLPLDSSEGFRY